MLDDSNRRPTTAPRIIHESVEFSTAPATRKRHRTRWILGDPDADAAEQAVEAHVRRRRGKDAAPTVERKAADVERCELLAKAVAKVPEVRPRKIYVDRRDGSIGEITTRDLGDKLLEREAIAGEVADGVRPKAILCVVCKCVVEVKPVGSIPRVCRGHVNCKLCPRGCGRTCMDQAKECRRCKSDDARKRAQEFEAWKAARRGERTKDREGRTARNAEAWPHFAETKGEKEIRELRKIVRMLESVGAHDIAAVSIARIVQIEAIMARTAAKALATP